MTNFPWLSGSGRWNDGLSTHVYFQTVTHISNFTLVPRLYLVLTPTSCQNLIWSSSVLVWSWSWSCTSTVTNTVVINFFVVNPGVMPILNGSVLLGWETLLDRGCARPITATLFVPKFFRWCQYQCCLWCTAGCYWPCQFSWNQITSSLYCRKNFFRGMTDNVPNCRYEHYGCEAQIPIEIQMGQKT